MRKFNKLLSVLLAVLMLFAVMPVGAMVSAADAIIDYNFEDGQKNFSSDCNLAVVEEDGSKLLHWDASGADWANIYVYTNVEAGTDYQVSFKLKASMDSALTIKFLAADWMSTVDETSAAASTEWSEIDVTLNGGQGGTVVFMVQTGVLASSGQQLYVDDVKVAKKSATTVTGPNLLANGDFETGSTAGWDNLWGGCTVSMVGGRDSANGVSIVSGEWKHFRQIINVKANTDYVLTLWAKDVKNVTLLIKDGNDTVNMEQKGINASSDAWAKTTMEFNTGNYSSIIVSLMGVAADAYGTFDDISLVCKDGDSVEPDQPEIPDVPGEPNEPALDNTGLIANGNFETGDDTGWMLYQTTKVDANSAKTGSYGLHVKGNGGWGGLGEQVINGLEIGKTYRINLWYKALSAGVNIQLCEGSNNSGAKLAYIYGNQTQWTEFAVEFEATTSTVCFALVGSGTGVAEEMYMDDISLTEVILGGNDDDPNLKMIDTLMDNIKTQGRTAMVRGTLMLDFTVSGIEFELDCAGDVYATFNASKISNVGSQGGLYFTIFVDGVALARDYCRLNSIGETKVLLAEDLPAGKHTFAIYRQTEHSFGEAGVCALSFEGEMLDKPADKDLYIEYIGDSISCGYGDLVSNGQGAGEPLYSDGTQAYTFITSQALNADWSTVSWSGLGCKYGYSDTTMQDVYPAQRYNYDKNTQYDFAKEPDVIILALGTNDNSIQGDATLKRAGLVEMLQLVRAKNPNAPIVWIHGMMTSGVSSMIESIVEEFGGAEAGYYACRLTQNNAGGGAHPSLSGQQKFADELVAFLQANGLAEGNDTPIIPEPPVVPDEPEDSSDLISGGETSRMENSQIGLGLAFQFKISANGIAVKNTNETDLTNAIITSNGEEYKLVGFGAVMSNDMSVGLAKDRLILDNVDGQRTLQISAKYLLDWDETGATYAVRIINIPQAHSATAIYARPYYIYENAAGEQVVVYDEIFCANYDGKFDFNDGVLEW